MKARKIGWLILIFDFKFQIKKMQKYRHSKFDVKFELLD